MEHRLDQQRHFIADARDRAVWRRDLREDTNALDEVDLREEVSRRQMARPALDMGYRMDATGSAGRGARAS